MGLLDEVRFQQGGGQQLRQQFPQLYGALGGLLGTAPDEFEGSVMDTKSAAVRKGAEQTYLMGTLAQMLGGLPTKSAQIARGLLQGAENLAAPAAMNRQAGMIRNPFGRIPETSKEIDKFADQLISRGEALGHQVGTGASNVSGSRYVTFKGGEGPDYQVRLSNHGDRYPNQLVGSGERFSVDADSGNTFEMAKQWLKDNGVNLSARIKQEKFAPIDDATLEKIVGMPVGKMREMGIFDSFKNKYGFRPDGTVVEVPTNQGVKQTPAAFDLAPPKARGVDGNLFQGFQGKTYYEPPDVRMEKLSKLFGAFGNAGGSPMGMSPKMARGLHEKGLLKATPSETKLLLDMTDEFGNIRPQIEAPPGVVNGNRSNDMYLNQLERDPKRQQYMYGR